MHDHEEYAISEHPAAHRIRNDSERVNVHADEEMRYRCDELDFEPEELREAVSAVDVDVTNVRLHLSQRGH